MSDEQLEPQRFNFSRFNDSLEGRWTSSLENETERFPTDFEALFNRIIIYEKPEIVGRVICACLLAPSALSRNLPLLFAIGLSGAGKSNLGKLAGRLYGCKVHGSGSTFASIRNDFQREKFTMGVEKNAILILEDADAGVFVQKPDLFRLVKSGTNRSTSAITIAGALGETIEFDCFGLKIISSITPIFAKSEFQELQRRAYISPHKKLEADELPENFIDIDCLESEGLNDDFTSFWEDAELCYEYVGIRSQLTKKGSTLKRKHKIKNDSWIISTDILATLSVCFGLTIDESCELLKAYLIEVQPWLDSKPQLFLLLREFINEEEKRFKMNQFVLGTLGEDKPFSVSAKTIRDKVAQWDRESFLDSKYSLESISASLVELGFRLDKGEWMR